SRFAHRRAGWVRVVDQQRRGELALAAVIEGDLDGQLGFLAAAVERRDHRGVLLCHICSPNLVGPRQFCVVGIELVVEKYDTPDPGYFPYPGVDLRLVVDDEAR